MVCMGNICRSPMAMVVANALAGVPTSRQDTLRLFFESAGTHAHHVGERTDARAAAALKRRGYVAAKHRSRRVGAADFERFDLILAMDNTNLAELQRLCPTHNAHKLRRFLDFSLQLSEREIPDPYYGSAAGFERVLDLCEIGANDLISSLRKTSR